VLVTDANPEIRERVVAHPTTVRAELKVAPRGLRRYLPDGIRHRYRRARDLAKTMRNLLYDGRRYVAHSIPLPSPSRPAQAKALITKYSHMIEKALALPAPRPGFGAEAVSFLCGLLDRELASARLEAHVSDAVGALQSYVAFNQAAGGAIPACVFETLQRASAAAVVPGLSATKPVTRADILRAVDFDAAAFFQSRYSVRRFSDMPVSAAEIREAVRMAQSSPSVCNRQSSHVTAVTGRAKIDEVLSFQNGNRGFGHQASAVLIVTSDLEAFVGSGERYQNWIDGGMFAMSLIWALHAAGLGACCLNWSNDASVDAAFRAAVNIPASHNVIMLIAVGNLPESLAVARSGRKSLQDVLTFTS
jgi:nitroreductase